MSIVEIPARDLARVLPFRATDDVRFYLNGVYVEPCETGCLLVATNGHWMAVVNSEDARADKARILSMSGGFEKAVRDSMSKGILSNVTVEAEQSRAILACASNEIYIEPGTPFLDGRFPEWRKVISPAEYLKPGLFAPLQTKYISALRRAVSEDYAGVKFWHDARDPLATAAVARFSKCPELVVFIMPLRDQFGETDWPSWMPHATAAETVAAVANS